MAVTSAGTWAGASASRFVSARCTIDSKRMPNTPTEMAAACGLAGGFGIGARPQAANQLRELAPDAAAQRVDLGRRTDAFEEDDPRRGRVGDEALDVGAHADFGAALVGCSEIEPRSHRVEQRAQAGLERAVHRVFAVVEERVERGAARACAAHDVFDGGVVVTARGELLDRGAHEAAALVGAALFGREPAVPASARRSCVRFIQHCRRSARLRRNGIGT